MQQLQATCTIFTPGHPDTLQRSGQHHIEKNMLEVVGRSSISAQSPTPNTTSLSLDPGWNLAPLPLCMQYRWQDRRACWCGKAVPVLGRCQGRKALAERGHQDQRSLPWSQSLFQRLLERFGKREGVSHYWMPLFKYLSDLPSSPQIVYPARWFFLLLCKQLLIYHLVPCPFLFI